MKAKADMSRLSRKEREYQLRRAEILRAAITLFGTKGYHATTMNEIAKEAEFSIGTLYNFFKSKEDLYFSLIYEKLVELSESISKTDITSGTVIDKFERRLETVLTFFDKERYLFRIFTIHQDSLFEAGLSDNFPSRVRERMWGHIEDLISMAEAGIKSQEFRDFSAQEIVRSFVGIMQSFIIMSIESEDEYPLIDKKSTIMDIFCNGIINQEQRKKR